MPQWKDGIAIYCQTADFRFHYTVQTLAGKRRMNGLTFKHATDSLNAKYAQTSHVEMNGELQAASLRLLSFPRKIVRYPTRDGVCQTDHRAAALSTEKLGSKNFVTK